MRSSARPDFSADWGLTWKTTSCPLAIARGTKTRPVAPVAPLGPDEWWAEELEGCAVHDRGRAVGTVARLLALPSCEVLEVRRADGGELLVPMVKDAVRDIDVAARRIEVDLDFLGETER